MIITVHAGMTRTIETTIDKKNIKNLRTFAEYARLIGIDRKLLGYVVCLFSDPVRMLKFCFATT